MLIQIDFQNVFLGNELLLEILTSQMFKTKKLTN